MLATCAPESGHVRAEDDPLIVPLGTSMDERMVGGKAANLGRLIAAGHAVPDGFVVTDRACRLFIAAADLAPLIDSLCGKLDVRSAAGLRAAAETIAALVRESPLPAGLDALLDDAASALGAGELIVRSSAVGEDSRAASFAGQLDSVADVRGPGSCARPYAMCGRPGGPRARSPTSSREACA
jgi:pyruvate,water dikinase